MTNKHNKKYTSLCYLTVLLQEIYDLFICNWASYGVFGQWKPHQPATPWNDHILHRPCTGYRLYTLIPMIRIFWSWKHVLRWKPCDA